MLHNSHYYFWGDITMMQFKKSLISLFNLAIILKFVFSLTLIKVNASDKDDITAIQGAPEGLNIAKYFDIRQPDISGKRDDFPYKTNNAETVSGGKVLSLAHGSGQDAVGAAWSNFENKNYINMNEYQKISAWLYFGSGIDSEDLNSEGMALVLHYDYRGPASMGSGFQGLGAYGFDATSVEKRLLYPTKFRVDNPTTVAESAIQNSIALEFDTKRNDVNSRSQTFDYPPLLNSYTIDNGVFQNSTYGNTYYTLNGFDTTDSRFKPSTDIYPANSRYGAAGRYGHIALTYPSLSTTYFQTPIGYENAADSNWNSLTDAYTMVHSGAKEAQLIDAIDQDNKPMFWHHLTFEWIPSEDGKTANIHYQFNDKYLDGTINNNFGGSKYPRQEQTFTVDPSIFRKNDGEKLFWGFTGSNNNNEDAYSKLVVFESIPALLNTDLTPSIIDTDLNKTIFEDSSDKTVAHGDNLIINYNIKYNDNGRVNWKNINSKIKLPDLVIYSPDINGNVATITYHNLKDGLSYEEKIPYSDLNNQELSHVLSKEIGKYKNNDQSKSDNYTDVDIAINGIADNTTETDQNVKSVPANFSSDEQITSVNSPNFTVKYKRMYTLVAKEPDEMNLIYKQNNANLNLPITLSYSDNHNFSNDSENNQIQYHITIDGHGYKAFDTITTDSKTFNSSILLKPIIENDSSSREFWDIFNITDENKTHDVAVTASDYDGAISNQIIYKIIVLPNKLLELNASSNLEFQDVNYISTAKHLHRKKDFNLNVTSQRSPWLLSVTTEGLHCNGNEFNGNMYFNTPAQILNSNPTLIDSDEVSHENIHPHSISQGWDDDTGILLNQNGCNKVGKYSGTLTWTLDDYDTQSL